MEMVSAKANRKSRVRSTSWMMAGDRARSAVVFAARAAFWASRRRRLASRMSFSAFRIALRPSSVQLSLARAAGIANLSRATPCQSSAEMALDWSPAAALWAAQSSAAFWASPLSRADRSSAEPSPAISSNPLHVARLQ